MICLQALEDWEAKNRMSIKCKIYATDINRTSVEIASLGAYNAADIENAVPPHFVKKYFKLHDNVMTIVPHVRSLLLFAVHNVVSDAPFSNVDIVLCRNTLIYFTKQLQRRVLQRFYFALKPSKRKMLAIVTFDVYFLSFK